MLIGIFLCDQGVLREALFKLGEQISHRGHMVRYTNFHMFRPSEKDRYDGVFFPKSHVVQDILQGEKLVETYDSENTHVFALEQDGSNVFIGDSPHVPVKKIREIVDFLLDDDS